MNWPSYIIIVFGSFMIFITVLVIKTYSVNTELVSDDYYKQELDYQNKIQKMAHSQQANNKVSMTEDDNFIFLSFSDTALNDVRGQIEFYRPSDASKDFTIPIRLTNHTQKISKESLAVGLYKIKLEWNSLGIDYYNEYDIYIQ